MNPFHGLEKLHEAFSQEPKPDFVLLDRISPQWQWDQVHAALSRGLVQKRFIEIDDQESQLRFYLTERGRESL